jgi:hypothetical protein
MWVGMALSVAAHGGLSAWRVAVQEQHVAKPLTTQFVKRQPRLTKPLELKKRPAPKRRRVQREMVAVKVRAGRRDISSVVLPVQLVGGLARPQADVRRITGLQEIGMEPAAIAGTIRGAMESEGVVDMSLEMMDLDALDTGRYHAMVIEDPGDKRNLTGFLHLAPVYSPKVKGHMAGSGELSGTAVSAPLAIRNVVRAVDRYTSLRADEIPAIPYNSGEIMKIPCLIIYLRPIRDLQDSESENLGRYLASGGFAFCEDCNVPNRYRAPFVRAILKKALASQGKVCGRAWEFGRLPKDHALYHCFFDFDELPPGGDVFAQHCQDCNDYTDGTEILSYMEGAELDGRLTAVVNLKEYIYIWGYWGDVNERRGNLDRTRYFQFAVNLIVFALTQEGSITHRVMEEVR